MREIPERSHFAPGDGPGGVGEVGLREWRVPGMIRAGSGSARFGPARASASPLVRRPESVMDGKAPRKSWWRRLLVLGLVLVVGAAGLVGALPWVLGLPAVRARALAAVNRAVAPSRVGLTGIRVSWGGPVRLEGVSLTGSGGKRLLSADSAVLDRGLFALMRDRNDLGTLTVNGLAVDVERRADGSIDLVDALTKSAGAPAETTAVAKPTAGGGPNPELTVRVVGGTLRLKSPELAEPLTAESMDAEIKLPGVAGAKLTWSVRLANPSKGAETLGIDGELDRRPATAGDLSLAVLGARWPLATLASGVRARGRLDGGLRVGRASGFWSTKGDAKLLEFAADGPALGGDRVAFDAVGTAWDVDQSAAAWTVRRLGVVCPAATLSATGAVATATAGAGADPGAVPDARLEAKVDLAALARQAPRALRLKDGLTLEQGSARLVAQIKTEGGVQQATVEADLSDLVAHEPAKRFTLREPASLTARAERRSGSVRVPSFELKTAFLAVKGSGALDKGVKFSGSVDLAGLEAQFRDLIDFGGVSMAGKGRLAAEFRKAEPGYVARTAWELKGFNLAGLTAAPVARDAVRFDAAVSGPADPSGLPKGWGNLRVHLKSDRDAVSLAATTQGDATTTAVDGTAALAVNCNGHDGRAQARVLGRWLAGGAGGGVVEMSELRLSLTPDDPALAAAGTVGFAAKGRLDLDGDDLELAPLPGPAPAGASVVLGAEGLKYHGLRRTPVDRRAAKAALVADLAGVEQALEVWYGRPPAGWGGGLYAHLGMGPGDPGALNLAVDLAVPELTRPKADGPGFRSEGPVALIYRGTYQPGADRLNVGALKVKSRYALLNASGRLDDPTGRRVADLAGTLAPDWGAMTALADEAIGPGTRLRGGPSPFHVRGPLSGDSLAAVLNGLDAEAGVSLTGAEAFGMALGPAPVVVRCKAGALSVDPIKTTLNNGAVDLMPGLSLGLDGGLTLSLAPGSNVEGAEINDEVSERVLSYVAPVLDQATQVHGTLTVHVDRGEFPLTGPADRTSSLVGQISFQNVLFAPGPFAKQLLTLTGRSDSPGLRLQEPVQLSVENRRVYQKGLEVPVRPDVKVTMEGSVGFDKTLDLRATVPITPAMLGQRSGAAGDLLGGQQVTVPIGGTVSKPQIDRKALQVALRDLTRNVLRREASQEATGLLDKVIPGQNGAAKGGPAPDDLEGLGKDLGNQLLKRLKPR